MSMHNIDYLKPQAKDFPLHNFAGFSMHKIDIDPFRSIWSGENRAKKRKNTTTTTQTAPYSPINKSESHVINVQFVAHMMSANGQITVPSCFCCFWFLIFFFFLLFIFAFIYFESNNKWVICFSFYFGIVFFYTSFFSPLASFS